MKNAHFRQIIAGALLLLLLSTVAFGTAGSGRVYDNAVLFTAEEVGELEQSIATLQADIQMDVVIVTTTDTAGVDTMAYADNFYDQGGFGTGPELSGVLLLLDMQHRQVYISTTGRMIELLTDADIQDMIAAVTGDLSDGYYYDAADEFLSQIYSQTRPGGLSLGWVLLFGVIALAVAGVSCAGVAIRYRMLFPEDNYSLQHNASLNLTRQEDIYLNTTTTQRKIERSSSSDGSSTHTSSSGQTHGGGGGSF